MNKCSKAKFLLALVVVVALAATLSYTARADGDDVVVLKARLTGFEETPPILTTGHATFVAKISPDNQSITFTETWTGLTGPPTVSHIHFGQPAFKGGVVIFLCTPPATPNPPQPACEQNATGSATGTLIAQGVLNPDQGVTPGNFADLLRIIRSGDSYANIHTAKWPSGEIRGQIHISHEDEGDDH
jgi:hypothetical protein